MQLILIRCYKQQEELQCVAITRCEQFTTLVNKFGSEARTICAALPRGFSDTKCLPNEAIYREIGAMAVMVRNSNTNTTKLSNFIKKTAPARNDGRRLTARRSPGA